MSFKVNAMALIVFILMLLGYFLMSFGETDFFRRLATAHEAYQEMHGTGGSMIKQYHDMQQQEDEWADIGAAAAERERGGAMEAARRLVANKSPAVGGAVAAAAAGGGGGGGGAAAEKPHIADQKMEAAAAAAAAGIPLENSINMNASAFLYFDDDSVWSEEYADLVSLTPIAVLLMMLILPMAVQASALLAENAATPVLVMETMKVTVVGTHLQSC